MKIQLDQQSRTMKVDEFQVQNEVVFSYFDKIPTADRASQLTRALYIGVLALMENRISAFLAKTSNELGTELESLKLIFDLKKELFYSSAATGMVAEAEIAEFLADYLKKSNLKDHVELTGNSVGALPRNKTGDIVCRLEGRDDLTIVIECKFDKSIKLGEIADKDIFTKNSDTAWSQLIEAAANRSARIPIIVFDKSKIDQKILNHVRELKYIPEIGFISIVDSQAGDYRNLIIAYMLARDIVINSRKVALDEELLFLIIERIIHDLRNILEIKDMVEENIEHNKNIMKHIEKSILSMEFNHEYLINFLKEGTMSKKDLLEFYRGGDLRERFKSIEKQIDELGS